MCVLWRHYDNFQAFANPVLKLMVFFICHFAYMQVFLKVKFPEVKLLVPRGCALIILKDITKLHFAGVLPVYTPTSNVLVSLYSCQEYFMKLFDLVNLTGRKGYPSMIFSLHFSEDQIFIFLCSGATIIIFCLHCLFINNLHLFFQLSHLSY